MMSYSYDGYDVDDFLDFKELEEQITQFVDRSELTDMLRMQLTEVEMLQSMFSNPGEFCIDDPSVIADMNDYVDEKFGVFPAQLDFIINLVLNNKVGVR